MKPIALLAALIVISITAASCSRNEAAPAVPSAPQVSVAQVLERNVVDADEFTGRLEAVESVQIRSRVTGFVERIDFTEGSEVKKGDLLFLIDSRPFRAELDKAEAELARAQAHAQLARHEVERGEKLLSVRALSREEYDQRINATRESQASLRAAQAAAETARLNLSFTRVTAPIAGRVSKAAVTVGNLVTGGSAEATLLTTIVSLDPIYVAFEGDEQVYLKYANLAHRDAAAARNPVRVGLSNEAGHPHEGRLVFLDNQLNPVTGSIRARALLNNPEGRFTPGLFARVKLMSNDTQPALLIDERAIGTDQSQKFVYVIDANNVVAYRAVELGKSIDGLRVVEDGLKPGERIVVNGLQRVRPGVSVAPKQVAMDRRQPGPLGESEITVARAH